MSWSQVQQFDREGLCVCMRTCVGVHARASIAGIQLFSFSSLYQLWGTAFTYWFLLLKFLVNADHINSSFKCSSFASSCCVSFFGLFKVNCALCRFWLKSYFLLSKVRLILQILSCVLSAETIRVFVLRTEPYSHCLFVTFQVFKCGFS